MLKLLLLSIVASLLALCTPEDDGKCKDSSGACDNCIKIYDSNGNFINEGTIANASQLYWNGTDCNGDTVPCGKYLVKMYYQGQTLSQETTVSSSNAIRKQGRSACDSLKTSCTGYYYEEINPLTGINCGCCK